MKIRPWCCVLWSVCMLVAVPGSAQAGARYVLIRTAANSVAPSVCGAFDTLWVSELKRKVGSVVHVSGPSSGGCLDHGCALQVGRDNGGDYVVYAQIVALGRRYVVTAAMLDVGAGREVQTERMRVEAVEDLDHAATRLAAAFAVRASADNTAELGEITEYESRDDRRKRGHAGFTARVGPKFPLGHHYGDSTVGLAVDTGFWYEARHFAVEARSGFRFDVDRNPGTFVEVPLDLGLYYIFFKGNFSPLIGGGAGMRILWEKVQQTTVLGSVVPTSSERLVSDIGAGFGAFARVGVMALRTYAVRVVAFLDYDFALVGVNDRDMHHAMQLTVGIAY